MLVVQRVQFVQPALIEHLLCVGMHTQCLPWHQMQCKVISSHLVSGLAAPVTPTFLLCRQVVQSLPQGLFTCLSSCLWTFPKPQPDITLFWREPP